MNEKEKLNIELENKILNLSESLNTIKAESKIIKKEKEKLNNKLNQRIDEIEIHINK
jgi:hypothetical protein